ncbi:hypothetical protein [Magnetospira sp. QH-2]|uniref:hypothetical protein n=1 Tax=Magnetospira sp. (strain QH-2) TaxID=1288970 RepID=UPI0003E81365|nr:hypothetical protein [Magnetospira sp. QH-2]CCQ72450.1 exported protein of unknown function [Magnetospira sp. QH-2]
MGMWTRIVTFATALILVAHPVRALPPGFDLTAQCQRLHADRERDIEYPQDRAKTDRFCRLRANGEEGMVASDQYYFALRRGLRFICKGKRPILMDLLWPLRDCNGETRTVSASPAANGQCRLRIVETGTEVLAESGSIEDLRQYLDERPWWESLASRLAAPALYDLMEEARNCWE